MNLGGSILMWIVENILPWVLLVFLFVVIPLALFAGIQEGKSPSFELKKNEWSCTQHHQASRTTYIMSGKISVPITNHTDVCDQWSSK